MSASSANESTPTGENLCGVKKKSFTDSWSVYPVPSPSSSEYRQTMRRERWFWVGLAVIASVVIGFWGTVIAYAVKWWG